MKAGESWGGVGDTFRKGLGVTTRGLGGVSHKGL